MVIPSLTGIFMEIPVWYDDPGPKYDPKGQQRICYNLGQNIVISQRDIKKTDQKYVSTAKANWSMKIFLKAEMLFCS